MAPSNRSQGRRLAARLDDEIYQVVQQIVDSQTQLPPSAALAATIYDTIRGSNSSLGRRPRNVLEDSIRRVLDVIEHDPDVESTETTEQAALDTQEALPSHSRALIRTYPAASSVPTADATEPHQHTMTRRQANSEHETPVRKKRKTKQPMIDNSPPRGISLEDLAGLDDAIQQMVELVALPLSTSQLYSDQGIQTPRGILIHGPPGCGKTMFVRAIAATLDIHFISIAASEIVSGVPGESEKALRDHFNAAKECAPCVVLIDEIDAIISKKDAEKRMVSQLRICMDDLDVAGKNGNPVIVLATTNRPDALDPGLRRGGRFDREINIPAPNESAREQILKTMLRGKTLSSDVDFTVLARRTPGFVGADLGDLVSAALTASIMRSLHVFGEDQNTDSTETEADHHSASKASSPPLSMMTTTTVSAAVKLFERVSQYGKQQRNNAITNTATTDNINSGELRLETPQMTMNDFLGSLPKIQPTTLREGFAITPDTTFDSIGASADLIEHLKAEITDPITEPEFFEKFGASNASGVLLWGPPGCGKTLLAKAVANSSHANFISIRGPELMNKYVGESERAVREVFTRARSSPPAIIFFDEIDALAPKRDQSLNEVSSRVVNTLLTELDGVGSSRTGIYVIAATNRPDIIDAAMVRYGRLETILYVGLPDAEGRVDIFRALCKKFKWAFSERLAVIARRCEGFSGADLEMLFLRVRQRVIKRRRALRGEEKVLVAGEATSDLFSFEDFEAVQKAATRSVSAAEMKRYERLKAQFAATGS